MMTRTFCSIVLACTLALVAPQGAGAQRGVSSRPTAIALRTDGPLRAGEPAPLYVRFTDPDALTELVAYEVHFGNGRKDVSDWTSVVLPYCITTAAASGMDQELLFAPVYERAGSYTVTVRASTRRRVCGTPSLAAERYTATFRLKVA